MADLTGRSGEGGHRRLPDRGQIMLIAGFVLATAFIALALILNSVIFTENLATRDTEARGSEAIAYQNDAVDGVETLVEFANRNFSVGSGVFSDIEDDFNTSVRSMNNGTARLQAGDGERTAITLQSTIEGRRLGQMNDSDRDFTAVDGSTDWDLATNVESTRAFRINVTDTDALLDTGLSDPFTVKVVNGPNEWEVEITKPSLTDTRLNVVGGGDCDGGVDPEMDLLAGTFDGERCGALEDSPFGDGVPASYTLRFENANQVAGNFSVVVNSTDPANSDAEYDSDTGTPFAAVAIYSATVHVTHESADIVYETDARAIPGESDD